MRYERSIKKRVVDRRNPPLISFPVPTSGSEASGMPSYGKPSSAMHVKFGGMSVDLLPQTFVCAGTSEKSCCTWTLTQRRFLPDDAGSQTFSALHFSPDAQSELVSHD